MQVSVIKQLYQTIEFLHSIRVAHKDLKFPNVLATVQGEQVHTYVIDFGEAYCPFFDSVDEDRAGSISYLMMRYTDEAREYMAREVWGRDVFALGAMSAELLFDCRDQGLAPGMEGVCFGPVVDLFAQRNPFGVRNQAVTGLYGSGISDEVYAQYRQRLNDIGYEETGRVQTYPVFAAARMQCPYLIDLVLKMLDHNPRERPHLGGTVTISRSVPRMNGLPETVVQETIPVEAILDGRELTSSAEIADKMENAVANEMGIRTYTLKMLEAMKIASQEMMGGYETDRAPVSGSDSNELAEEKTWISGDNGPGTELD